MYRYRHSNFAVTLRLNYTLMPLQTLFEMTAVWILHWSINCIYR